MIPGFDRPTPELHLSDLRERRRLRRSPRRPRTREEA